MIEESTARKILIMGIPTTNKEWASKVAAQTKGELPIQSSCNIDILFRLPPTTFTKMGRAKYGPDIDNLQKRLFDGLKKTILRKQDGGDDSLVMGVRAIKRRVASENDAGITIWIIPTYTLKIHSVEFLAVEEAKKINKIWTHKMQKIKASIKNKDDGLYGKQRVFIDNIPGHLFLVKHWKESENNFQDKYPQINPGYMWKTREGQEVSNVMIVKRYKRYWINTW